MWRPRTDFRFLALLPVSLLALPGGAGPTPPRSASDLILGGLIEIFSDDFESGECAPWSATTNPAGAPDADEDDFGDELQATTFCQLPAGLIADATDCDDADQAVNPDADEICNEVDDDCDGEADDGFLFQEDEQNCGSCGNVCEATNCTNTCAAGQCAPVCNFGFFNCDFNNENGCEAGRNTNPTCPGTNLGELAGDEGSDILMVNGFAEAWYFVRIVENAGPGTPLTARVSLNVPTGVDFDLYAYCLDCGGTLAASSTGTVGVDEEVLLRANDDLGEEDDHFVVIEIRFAGGSAGACSNWTLTVEGNAGAAPAQTCDP